MIENKLVRLAPEYNMAGLLRRDKLNAFVAERARVNPTRQTLSLLADQFSDMPTNDLRMILLKIVRTFSQRDEAAIP
jgi:hypothetical protein